MKKFIKEFIRIHILKRPITEIFEAFTYVYENGTLVPPGQLSSHIRWLKDVTIEGVTHEEREEKAFKIFREQNNLKLGQVWIW